MNCSQALLCLENCKLIFKGGKIRTHTSTLRTDWIILPFRLFSHGGGGGWEEENLTLPYQRATWSFWVLSTVQRSNLKLQFCCNNRTEGAEGLWSTPNTESFPTKLLEETVLNSHSHQAVLTEDKAQLPFPSWGPLFWEHDKGSPCASITKVEEPHAHKKQLIKPFSKPKHRIQQSNIKLHRQVRI